MKVRISGALRLPMLYGILLAWIVAGAIAVPVLAKTTTASVLTDVIAASAILLMALWPALRRGAWVYSNARKHHSAEYFYDLGNGVDNNKALANYEKRVQKAVGAWMKRYILTPAFGAMPVGYFLLVLQSGNWLASMWVFVAVLIVVVAIYIGMWTMLFSARKLCYDKYGNLKNH